MRTTKKHLLAILLVLVAVLALSFTLAACNSDEQPEQPKDPAKTTYTVTIAPYEATQGTVTLAPASADGKYEEGTIVTVTVSAKAGFEVQSFAVSTDQNAALDNDGKYKLTVSANTTITATFKSTNVAVTSVTVSPAQSSLEVGRDDDQNKTVQLTAEVLPANATNKAVTWTSEDPTIATVSETGIVTAIAEGSATIKATAGGIEGTATITVTTHAHAAAAEAEWQNEDGKHFKLCACGRHVDEATCAAAPEASWEVDDENDQHYHECAICGDHIDVADCSAEGDAWITNADEHYQECSECYQQFNKANHIWGKPQPTEDGSQHQIGCTECTYKQDPVAHVRPEVVTEATPVTEGTDVSHSFACADCGGTMTEKCGEATSYVNIACKVNDQGYHVLYCKLCGRDNVCNSKHTFSIRANQNRYDVGENEKHIHVCLQSLTWYDVRNGSRSKSISCDIKVEENCTASSSTFVVDDDDAGYHVATCIRCLAKMPSTKAAHTSESNKYIPYGENSEQHVKVCDKCSAQVGQPESHTPDTNGLCACGNCTHLKLKNVHGDFIDGTCAGCNKQVLFTIVEYNGNRTITMIEGAEEKYLSSLGEIKLNLNYDILQLKSNAQTQSARDTIGLTQEIDVEGATPLSEATIAKIKSVAIGDDNKWSIGTLPLGGFTAVESVYVLPQGSSNGFNAMGLGSTVKTIVYKGSFNLNTGKSTFATTLLNAYMENADPELKIFLPLDISVYKSNLTYINSLSGTNLTKWNALKSHLYLLCEGNYIKSEFEGFAGAYRYDDSGSDVVLGDEWKIKILTKDDELKVQEATYSVGIAWRGDSGSGDIKSTEVKFEAGGAIEQTVVITLSASELSAHAAWPNIQLFVKGVSLDSDVYYENETSCTYSGTKYSKSTSGKWNSDNTTKGNLWYNGTVSSGTFTFTITIQADGTITKCVIS